MKSLTDVFLAFQTLQSEGVVENYAVGGTIAALFSAEAPRCFEMLACTLGLNEQRLSDWTHIYNFTFRDGVTVIHGVPVRFVEQRGPLEREAIDYAELKKYGDVSVRVMCAEHLIAFNISNRSSGWGYSPSYFAPETLDIVRLEAILERANLLSKWHLCKGNEEDAAPGGERFRSKRRWHEENARLPVLEKTQQVLQLQKHDLPLIAARRPLKWWEKPWDIEP